MIEQALALCIGFVSSIAGAYLGIGGGIIIVPALVMLLGIQMHSAVAVSLATIVSTSTLVTMRNLKKGIINFDMGIKLELTTALFAILAGFFAIHVNQALLKAIFGAFLLLFAIFMYLKPEPKAVESDSGAFSYYDEFLAKRVSYDVKHPTAAVIISSFAGFLSGMLGIGGGIVKVPILNGICGIPMKVASATSSMMVGITAASASLIYLKYGYQKPTLVLFTSIGAIAGSGVGLFFSKKTRNETVKLVFVLMLVAVGVEMIIKAVK